MTLSMCPACRVGLERCLVCGASGRVWVLDPTELRGVWRTAYAAAFALFSRPVSRDGVPVDLSAWANLEARKVADAAVEQLRAGHMPTMEPRT